MEVRLAGRLIVRGILRRGFSSGASQTRHERKPRQKAWNEAASVMIVSPMNFSEPYSLGYLMVERSRTGKIMPGNWVYPGGNVDESDRSSKWIKIFQEIANLDITQHKILHENAHKPGIYEDDKESPFPKEISLRITAIREVFEEAGILLCRPKRLETSEHLYNSRPHYEFKALQDKKLVQSWQKRVRKDGQAFLELCQHLEVIPDIFGLHDWSNWLTPTIFKPKSRFDTMIYMAILPKLTRVIIDGNEAVTAQWISPTKAIEEHSKGNLRLMPPQIYEFTRLSNLKSIPELEQRIKLRRELGLETFLPVLRNFMDGTLFLLPGDDLYPDPPNYLEMDPQSLEEVPKTIKQMEMSSVNLHRGIANTDGAITRYEINVQRYGNIY